jgi:DNA-binding MarR family transcriptional regulator
MNQTGGEPRGALTLLQGQYLAFIHAYTLVNGRPPAEHEMMRFFQVTPPTVHRMVVTLEQAGLISRSPGKPTSIAVLLDKDHLPRLEPGFGQTVKTTVTRY